MAIYLANDKYNASLSAGYTAGQNTLSVSNVPDNVPTIVVAAKGTDNETVFSVTGKTVSSLTGVARLRGANVDLDAQTPIACLNNAEFVNQYATAVSTPETLTPLYYAEDGGSTDAYAVALDPAIVDYVTGLMVAFKANTANTGAASLNVNAKGVIAIKKGGTADLATGDILAGQIVEVFYDGTNFQLIGVMDLSTYLTLTGVQTMTNKRRTRRAVVVTQSATPAINTDNMDIAQITGLAQAITSMTSGLTGTPVDGDLLEIQITDNATARAITWGTSFASTANATLPTTTVISTRLRVLLEWNATTSKWDCVAVT